MSIKSKRVDVATLCLSRVGNAKALRALRDIEGANEEERAGMIALHLGMYDTAKELYSSKSRIDLLNDLYQLTGSWEASLESHHRTGLKKEFYKFGTYLSQLEDVTGAIAAFEKSGNH